MIGLHALTMRRVAAIVLLLAAASTLWFGLRSYRTFFLLRAAYELGVPRVSHVRGWMTLRYVADTYRVPADALLLRLDLAPTTELNDTLKTLGEHAGVSPFDFVQRVQRAIAKAGPAQTTRGNGATSTCWFDFGDRVLSAFLVYGYPALALTLLLGAVGAPVPTGFATVLAGTLAAKGQMSWPLLGAIAVVASIVGDVVAYAIGRVLGERFLKLHEGWFGLTAQRRARVERMFVRWGGVTVLLTRTLISHLSSVVSVLAGLGRYGLPGFLAFAFVGRVIWASAYLGLGYGIGGNLDAATGFLANLSGLFISLAITVAAALAYARQNATQAL